MCEVGIGVGGGGVMGRSHRSGMFVEDGLVCI